MAGLENKYQVRRTSDNASVDDGFVLRVQKDPAGWMAAWYYASITRNEELRRDMHDWLRQNMPTDESLGTEGSANRELLGEVLATVERR